MVVVVGGGGSGLVEVVVFPAKLHIYFVNLHFRLVELTFFYI